MRDRHLPAVFAGSHTLSIDDRSTRDYLELGLWLDEDLANNTEGSLQAAPSSSAKEGDELRTACSNLCIQGGRLIFNNNVALLALLERLQKLGFLCKSGDTYSVSPPESERNETPTDDKQTLWLQSYVKTLIVIGRLRKAAERDQIDNPSFLPIFDCLFDGTKYILRIRLRLKRFLSPMEMSARGNSPYLFGRRGQRGRRPITVFAGGTRKSRDRKGRELGPRRRRILPLVCSDSFRPENIRSFDNIDLTVIVSLSPTTRWFDPVIDMSVHSKVPVVYCNDGTYGRSTISVQHDEKRSSGDEWFGEPFRGRLPPGDGILVLEVLPNAATQVGTSQPVRTWGFVALAAIVPDNQQDPSFLVAKRLYRMRKEAEAGDKDLSSRISGLIDIGQPTEIQLLKLRTLLEICKPPSTALPARWREWGADCIIPISESAAGATPRKSKKVESLRQLTQRFARQLLPRLNWLLTQPEITAEQSKAIIETRNAVIHLLGGNIGRSVVHSVAALMEDMSSTTLNEARKRLTHRLGSIVEWFGGTSGWLLMLDRRPSDPPVDEQELDTLPAVARALLQRSASRNEMKALNTVGRFLFEPVVVHNSPGTFPSDAMEGISGWVARHWQPYLCNSTTDATGRSLDPYNRRLVRGSKATVAVPIILQLPRDIEGESAKYPELIPTNDLKSLRALDEDRDLRILAVLTIEANEAGAFLPALIGHLQVAASRLAPDLLTLALCMSSKSDAIWHPQASNWNLNSIVERYCFTLTTSIPGADNSPAIGASFWYADSASRFKVDRPAADGLLEGTRRLWVLGASRFDFEYENRRTLPFSSFVGSIIKNESSTRRDKVYKLNEVLREQAVDFLAGQRDAFRRPVKARRMELEDMYAAALYSRADQPPRGILSLYFFRSEYSLSPAQRETFFADGVIRRLARYLGRIFRNACEIRRLYAIAELQSKIFSAALPGRSVYSVVHDCLRSIFGLQGCTIFELIRYREKYYLSPVAGEVSAGTRPDDAISWPTKQTDPTGYHVGITNYLACRPGSVIRKRDSRDPRESVRGFTRERQVDPKKPLLSPDPNSNDVMEGGLVSSGRNVLERVITDGPRNVRFLGYSLPITSRTSVGAASADAAVAGGGTRVIFRLIRTPDQPPFIEEDEDLLEEIGWILEKALGSMGEPLGESELTQVIVAHGTARMKAEEIAAVLQKGDSVVDAEFVSASGETISPKTPRQGWRAVERIYHEAGGRCEWNRRLLEAVLQDLLYWFRVSEGHDPGYRPIMASLRFVTLNDHSQPLLQLAALRSNYSSELPDENDVAPVVRELGNLGWEAIDEGKIVVFNKNKGCDPTYQRIHEDSEYVNSGVCAPFYFFANNHSCRGVLSVDFSGDVTISPVDILPTIVAVTRRLSVMAFPNNSDSADQKEWGVAEEGYQERHHSFTEEFVLQSMRDCFLATGLEIPDRLTCRLLRNSQADVEDNDQHSVRRLLKTFASQFGREMIDFGVRFTEDRRRALVPLYVSSYCLCYLELDTGLSPLSVTVYDERPTRKDDREINQKYELALAMIASQVYLRWHKEVNGYEGLMHKYKTVVGTGEKGPAWSLFSMCVDPPASLFTEFPQPKVDQN